MKNLFFSIALLSLAACNSKPTQPEATQTNSQPVETPLPTDSITKTETTAALYSCPMHPEVKGNKDDECPKCGMKLTEPVK